MRFTAESVACLRIAPSSTPLAESRDVGDRAYGPRQAGLFGLAQGSPLSRRRGSLGPPSPKGAGAWAVERWWLAHPAGSRRVRFGSLWFEPEQPRRPRPARAIPGATRFHEWHQV